MPGLAAGTKPSDLSRAIRGACRQPTFVVDGAEEGPGSPARDHRASRSRSFGRRRDGPGGLPVRSERRARRRRRSRHRRPASEIGPPAISRPARNAQSARLLATPSSRARSHDPMVINGQATNTGPAILRHSGRLSSMCRTVPGRCGAVLTRSVRRGFGREPPWGERSGPVRWPRIGLAPCLPAIARCGPRSSRLAPWWLPKASERRPPQPPRFSPSCSRPTHAGARRRTAVPSGTEAGAWARPDAGRAPGGA